MSHFSHHDRTGDQPIPGYRLLHFLGKGQFGEVWMASSPGNKRVALKIIDLRGREGLKEFEALERIKDISHPNLVPIFAYWVVTSDGLIMDDPKLAAIPLRPSVDSPTFLKTMSITADQEHRYPVELIVAMGLGAKNLSDRLEECTREGTPGIPLEELLRYMDGAAEGIDYLNAHIHDLGRGPVSIIHGDIKPQNLLIVGNAVQICDFGLARDVDTVRRTATAMGTYAYAAPELLEGHPHARSDQYCLAVSYIELRTGDLPLFGQTNLLAVAQLHREGKLDLSKLEQREAQVIYRATRPDPTQRWPSCRDLVRELRRSLEVGTFGPVPQEQVALETGAGQARKSGATGTVVPPPVFLPTAERPVDISKTPEPQAVAETVRLDHGALGRKRRLLTPRLAALLAAAVLLAGLAWYFWPHPEPGSARWFADEYAAVKAELGSQSGSELEKARKVLQFRERAEKLNAEWAARVREETAKPDYVEAARLLAAAASPDPLPDDRLVESWDPLREAWSKTIVELTLAGDYRGAGRVLAQASPDHVLPAGKYDAFLNRQKVLEWLKSLYDKEKERLVADIGKFVADAPTVSSLAERVKRIDEVEVLTPEDKGRLLDRAKKSARALAQSSADQFAFDEALECLANTPSPVLTDSERAELAKKFLGDLRNWTIDLVKKPKGCTEAGAMLKKCSASLDAGFREELGKQVRELWMGPVNAKLAAGEFETAATLLQECRNLADELLGQGAWNSLSSDVQKKWLEKVKADRTSKPESRGPIVAELDKLLKSFPENQEAQKLHKELGEQPDPEVAKVLAVIGDIEKLMNAGSFQEARKKLPAVQQSLEGLPAGPKREQKEKDVALWQEIVDLHAQVEAEPASREKRLPEALELLRRIASPSLKKRWDEVVRSWQGSPIDVDALIANAIGSADKQEYEESRKALAKAREELKRKPDENQSLKVELIEAIVELSDAKSDDSRRKSAVTLAEKFKALTEEQWLALSEELSMLALALGQYVLTSGPGGADKINLAIGLAVGAREKPHLAERDRPLGLVLAALLASKAAACARTDAAADKLQDLQKLDQAWSAIQEQLAKDIKVDCGLIDAWLCERLLTSAERDANARRRAIAIGLGLSEKKNPGNRRYVSYVRALLHKKGLKQLQERELLQELKEALAQRAGEAKDVALSPGRRLCAADLAVNSAKKVRDRGPQGLFANPFDDKESKDLLPLYCEVLEAAKPAEEAAKPAESGRERDRKLCLFLAAAADLRPEIAGPLAAELITGKDWDDQILRIIAVWIRCAQQAPSLPPPEKRPTLPNVCRRLKEELPASGLDDKSVAKLVTEILAPVLKQCEAAAKAPPANADDRNMVVSFLIKLGDFLCNRRPVNWAQLARDAYTRAIECTADDPAGLKSRAECYAKRGRARLNETDAPTSDDIEEAIKDGQEGQKIKEALKKENGQAGQEIKEAPKKKDGQAREKTEEALQKKGVPPDVSGLLANAMLLRSRLETRLDSRVKDLKESVQHGEDACQACRDDQYKDHPLRARFLLSLSSAYVELVNWGDDDVGEKIGQLRKAVQRAEEAAELAGKTAGPDEEGTKPQRNVDRKDEIYLALGNAYEDLAWLVEYMPETHYPLAIKMFKEAKQADPASAPLANCSIGRCYYRAIECMAIQDSAVKPSAFGMSKEEEVLERCKGALRDANKLLPGSAEAYSWLGNVCLWEVEKARKANPPDRTGAEKAIKEADQHFRSAIDHATNPAGKVEYTALWAEVPLQNWTLTAKQRSDEVGKRIPELEALAKVPLAPGALEDAGKAAIRIRGLALREEGRLKEAIDTYSSGLPDSTGAFEASHSRLLLARARCKLELARRENVPPVSEGAIQAAEGAIRDAKQVTELVRIPSIVVAATGCAITANECLFNQTVDGKHLDQVIKLRCEIMRHPGGKRYRQYDDIYVALSHRATKTPELSLMHLADPLDQATQSLEQWLVAYKGQDDERQIAKELALILQLRASVCYQPARSDPKQRQGLRAKAVAWLNRAIQVCDPRDQDILKSLNENLKRWQDLAPPKP
jgi:serine/threonine protein kinase